MRMIPRSMIIAAVGLGIPLDFIVPPAAIPPGDRRHFKRIYHRNRTTLHATNGKRECARRRRQIAEGRLKPENGLIP